MGLLAGPVQAASRIVEANEGDPWLNVRLLPGQHEYLHDPAPARLFRGPQQAIGKTWAGVLDLIGHGTGLHPWCPPELISPTAITGWVVCGTWGQSVEVQTKIWELAPKRLMHPEDVARYDDVRGWGRFDPSFRLMHRSGAWSTFKIKTSKQGGLSLSSASIDYAWFDEPPWTSRIFGEVQKRVLKAGRYGRLGMTMTPINVPTIEWLRVEVEEGGRLNISDHHHKLLAPELIPVGYNAPLVLADGTPCDEAWVQSQRMNTLAHEVPVVCDGEFRMAAEAPIFTAFRRDKHIVHEWPAGKADLYIGFDHGLAVHAQVAVLLAVQWPRGKGRDPMVWVLDEAIGDGETTDDDDAEAVLQMLERNGLLWSQLEATFGDRSHRGATRIVQKSNGRLMAAIARHPRAGRHGIRAGIMEPPIRPAKRGAANQPGAVSYGCTWLHRLMLQPGMLKVHRQATFCTRSFLGYDMTPNSPESHVMDAIRYGLKALIYSTRLPGRPAVVRIG